MGFFKRKLLISRLFYLSDWFFLLLWLIMEVSAPPDFLNNSVEEYGRPKREVDQQPQYHHHHRRHGRRKHNKDKKDLPAGMPFYRISVFWVLGWLELSITKKDHLLTTLISSTNYGITWMGFFPRRFNVVSICYDAQ